MGSSQIEDSVDVGFMCCQCRSINFDAILRHMANLKPGECGDRIVSERVGLDMECTICRLFGSYILPGTYKEMPGPQTRWQLRAFSIRGMIVDNNTSHIFRPAPIAIFHAGEGRRDYISHINNERVLEERGFLACGRTAELRHAMENVYGTDDYQYPKSRFIAKCYNPDLIKNWMSFEESWEAGDEDSEIGDSDDEPPRDASPTGREPDEAAFQRDNTVSSCSGSALSPMGSPLHCGYISQGQTYTTLSDNSSVGIGSDRGINDCIDGIVDEEMAVEGMLVIDCRSLNIIDRTMEMPYVALSYVWSLAHKDMVAVNRDRDRDLGGLSKRTLPSEIPRVVHNAIQVTMDIGLQYLWVDQFCIDQQGPAEKIAEHVSKMDIIYSQAELTIVAASTYGALPGVGATTRTKPIILNISHSDEELTTEEPTFTVFSTPPQLDYAIMKRLWFSRGWCFQESLLSRRRLYFTDHQMFYEAEGIHCSETFTEPHDDVDDMLGNQFADNPSLSWPASWDERLKEAQGVSDNDLSDPRIRFLVEARIFTQLVRTYTSKDLSYDSDSLNGFRGAMKVFSRNDSRFQTIQGQPIFDISILVGYGEDSEEFQRQAFMLMLDWIHVDFAVDTIPKRRLEFPSWSWAGWKAKADWKECREDFCFRTDLVHNMIIRSIEDSDQNAVGLDEAVLRFNQRPSTPTCLIIDALCLTFKHFRVLKESWKLTPWQCHVNCELSSSFHDTESSITQQIRDGRWACLLLYAYTSPERQHSGGDKFPAEDNARMMVVCWEDSEMTGPYNYKTCSRIGMLSFKKKWSMGSTESSIEKTFSSLTRGTFRLS